MDGGIQPTYNLADRGYGYGDGFGFGGGSGIWLFAILALMWGGNGFFGNRGGCSGNCATVEDLAAQSNFTRLENQVRANENLIQQGIATLGNGICDLGYRSAVDYGNLRYENAMNTACINATTTAGIQKILDKMCEDQTRQMQSRISQLELQQALCGVVRYPTNLTYTAGASPFAAGCGCGYTNI